MTGEPVSARAAVLQGPGEIAIEGRGEPERRSGQALVRVVASGICGTDVEIVRGGILAEPGRVLGHEGAGSVASAPTTARLEPGTPVVIDPTIACGSCPVCLDGLPNLCLRGGLLGRELDGVFADLVSVPVANLHPIPDSIALEDAPLLQVLATVVHAQERVTVTPGYVAAVIGLGFTGQLHAQLLRHRGARVLGVTRSAEKRNLAARLACEWTAPPDAAPDAVREVDPGVGADLVVESAGTLDALGLALELVRPGGTILAYGIQTEDEGRLPFYDLYYKEVTLVAARSLHPRDMRAAIDLVAGGAVEPAPLVSDRLGLADAREAVERTARGALKVVMSHV